MRSSIPTLVFYRRQPSQPDSYPVVELAGGDEADPLFSNPGAAAKYRDTHPQFSIENGWEIGGPMEKVEFLQFLEAYRDTDLVARDPKPWDTTVFCIEVARLRELVASGETEADFEPRDVAEPLKAPNV